MKLELAAQKRTNLGRAVKADRQSGLIPAELYGPGIKNEHLKVAKKEFAKILKVAGENSIVNIMVDGKAHPVLIHDVQRTPVSDEVLNVDFYQVDLALKIKVRVPIEFTGIAPAVKDLGGILVKPLHELEVEALPLNLPHSVTIDISGIKEIGQSAYVKDIKLSADVKPTVSLDTVVATVTAKMTEEQEAALSATVDVSTIKSEGDEKKAERDAAKAEAVVPATAGKPAAGKAAPATAGKPAAKPAATPKK